LNYLKTVKHAFKIPTNNLFKGNMMRFQKIILIPSLLALITPCAMANDGSSGFYGALDMGQSDIRDACNKVAAGESCSKTSTATRVSLGYQFGPTWAAEMGFISGAKSSYSGPGFSAEKSAGFQLALQGSWPVADRVALLGRVGFADGSTRYDAAAPGSSVSQTSSGSYLLLGVGARYDFSRNLAARALYEVRDIGADSLSSTPLPNEGTTRLTLLSAGLVYRF
jgi:OmpA-OmpF porin, OOP family